MTRTIAMMSAALFGLVAPGWAQQNEKEKSGDSPKAAVAEPCEIRAYLLNKERSTINIVGVTALLVAEGKDGNDVLIPLQVVTTKAGEKYALRSSATPRTLEGTAYSVSLITVPADGHRRSEGKDADGRVAKGAAQEPAGNQTDASNEADRTRFTLEGPYFKADVTAEQLAGLTCKASVRFTINGSMHSAKGFSCAAFRGGMSQGTTCPRLAAECDEIGRHLKAGEMDKATIAVDRLSASLSTPCGDAGCQHARHGCASCCKDLRAAIASGNREKSLEALEALKAQCSTCAASKDDSKKDGDKK